MKNKTKTLLIAAAFTISTAALATNAFSNSLTGCESLANTHWKGTIISFIPTAHHILVNAYINKVTFVQSLPPHGFKIYDMQVVINQDLGFYDSQCLQVGDEIGLVSFANGTNESAFNADSYDNRRAPTIMGAIQGWWRFGVGRTFDSGVRIVQGTLTKQN